MWTLWPLYLAIAVGEDFWTQLGRAVVADAARVAPYGFPPLRGTWRCPRCGVDAVDEPTHNFSSDGSCR